MIQVLNTIFAVLQGCKYVTEVGEGVLLWASVTKNEISFF
jgi:hypothetical protein